jgi:hypothetical protein
MKFLKKRINFKRRASISLLLASFIIKSKEEKEGDDDGK